MKVDMWEWCSTRRGFSLSSVRFSTFFCPCWSLGGHVLNLQKDVRGGEGHYVVKTEEELSDLTNYVCIWWLAACVTTKEGWELCTFQSRFWLYMSLTVKSLLELDSCPLATWRLELQSWTLCGVLNSKKGILKCQEISVNTQMFTSMGWFSKSDTCHI